ncbi:hypothetical protein, partial [Xanthomonas albilineans]
RQVYAAINDIIPRADFFGAMARQTGAVWFAVAENQSRTNLSGPIFGLGDSYNKFWVGTVMEDWRSAAGNEIMSHGYDSFNKIYMDRSVDPVQWSLAQIGNEQRDPVLQKIHENYIKKMAWPSVELMQKIGGVENIFDPESRVDTGCRNMGFSNGCAGKAPGK